MKKTAMRSILVSMAACVSMVSLAGCKHTSGGPPTRSGFLSSYHHLEMVDESTYRYVNKDRARLYKRFHILPVAVTFDEYKGKPVTPEQRKRIAEYVHQALSGALGDRYAVVDQPGIDVGEMRVALTSAFKKDLQVGFTLEGELLDSYSAVQVAAATRSMIGEPYLGNWWEAPSFREMIDAWAKGVRALVDEAHR